MKETTVATTNPLYERLYNRFSYSGKTVGEMMLLRARREGADGTPKNSNLIDMTAETCITRANLLPKSADTHVRAKAVHAFSLRRLNPCALLSFVLFAVICFYLLFAGIRQSLRPFDGTLIELSSSEMQMYEPSIDSPLPF